MTLEQFVCWAMAAVCKGATVDLLAFTAYAFHVGAGGGVYGYMQKKSLPSLVAGLSFGALYGISARFMQIGRDLDGVDLSICKPLSVGGIHYASPVPP